MPREKTSEASVRQNVPMLALLVKQHTDWLVGADQSYAVDEVAMSIIPNAPESIFDCVLMTALKSKGGSGSGISEKAVSFVKTAAPLWTSRSVDHFEITPSTIGSTVRSSPISQVTCCRLKSSSPCQNSTYSFSFMRL